MFGNRHIGNNYNAASHLAALSVNNATSWAESNRRMCFYGSIRVRPKRPKQQENMMRASQKKARLVVYKRASITNEKS